MLGNGLGVYTGLEINSHRPPQQPENYRKAKQASQGKDAQGISQTGRNRGPGLFLHILEEDEVSQIPDISADDIINGLKRGNAAHSSQQVANGQPPTRAQRYQQSVQPSKGNTWEAIKAGYAVLNEIASAPEIVKGVQGFESGVLHSGYEMLKGAFLTSPTKLAFESLGVAKDVGMVVSGLDKDRTALARITGRWHEDIHQFKELGQSAKHFYHELTSHDVYRQGYALGELYATGLTLFAGGEGAIVDTVRLPSRLGLFARGTGQRIQTTFSGEAVNHINKLRLQQQLMKEEVSTLFEPSGELSQAAIKNSRRIPLQINNPQLKQILSERPGNSADWGKYETIPVHTEAGLARVHFYYNPVTGDVYYGMDYKAIFDHQGSWKIELKPNFSYKPLQYNL